jgi:hypothetical protein
MIGNASLRQIKRNLSPEASPTNNIVWQPIPGSSQELALDSRAHHTLYHGARGPGKTVTQLMRFRKNVGKGYGAFWRGVIFDKEYKNLSDLVAQSKRFFRKFGDGATFLAAASEYKWVWPTGEELLFRHVKKESDYDQFHGHEYPFIGWNELTKHASGALYFKLMSCNRSSFVPELHTPRRIGHNGGPPLEDEDGNPLYDTIDGKPLPEIPLDVFSTTNPSGPGHGWVKRIFIDVGPGVHRRETLVFNPRTQQEEIVTKMQVAIFGSWRENTFLPPEYVAELMAITDENLKRAWLYGDWDIVAGGAFDDVWRKATHVKKRFKVPAGWKIDRTLDWGSSHPFSVGWWCEANGEEAVIEHKDGTIETFCPQPGSLIQLGEWYGTKEIGTNVGLKLSAPDLAQGIIRREIELMQDGWITVQPSGGPADNQIRDVREVDVDTIELKMSKLGVRWTESDKSPGSRRNGMQLMRDRLEAAYRGEGPGLYFMDNCVGSISTIPNLPRDEEKIDDVDTSAEDHPYDMARYRVLKGNNRAATTIHTTFAH